LKIPFGTKFCPIAAVQMKVKAMMSSCFMMFANVLLL
jgi:hypothetical protein